MQSPPRILNYFAGGRGQRNKSITISLRKLKQELLVFFRAKNFTKDDINITSEAVADFFDISPLKLPALKMFGYMTSYRWKSVTPILIAKLLLKWDTIQVVNTSIS